MTTLYRKYRPQSFADIIGQSAIKITLQNELITGQIAHAYLFSGPRGIGKTTIARILSRAVNCEKRSADTGEPCNECVSCKEILEGKSLDIIEIDAASHTGVEMVRAHIIENARFTPSRLKYKVFIIDEAHMLSNASFNALLKTLEEPPAHVIFILATTELHKFPVTIVSRCQRFDFRRIGEQLVVERLTKLAEREGVHVEPSVLSAIARRASGSMRDAESVLGQLFVLGTQIGWDEASMVLPHSNREDALSLAELLLAGDARGGLALIHRLRDEGMELGQFTADFVEFMRELLLVKLAAVPPSEDEAGMNDLAGRIESGKLLRWIDRFNRRRYEQKGAEIPELPLELAIVETCVEGQGAGNKPESQAVGKPVILRAERSGVEKLGSQEVRESKGLATQEKKTEKIEKAEPAAKVEDKKPETPVVLEKKEEEVAVPAEGVVAVEDVRSRWNELIANVKEENPSLPILLMVAKPLGVVGRTIRVGLEYPFHREKLVSLKNRAIVEQALSGIFGKPLSIEVVSVEPEQDKALDAVLNTFGGRVVG